MESDVFISYSRKDEEFAYRLAQDLEEQGIRVWIDRGNIVAGEQWHESIVGGVRHCKAFVLILSPNMLNSHMVIQELAIALAHRKVIIPLYYRETQVSSTLAAQLAQYQALDFYRGSYHENLEDLLSSLTAHAVALDDSKLTPEKQKRRRQELLGRRRATNWLAVLQTFPGWVLTWTVGWTLFWTLLQILFLLLDRAQGGVPGLLISGIIGGVMGAVLVANISSLALRRYAEGIKWRHLFSSLPIWFAVVFVGVVFASALLYWLQYQLDGDSFTLGNVLLASPLTLVTALTGGYLVGKRLRRLEPGMSRHALISLIGSWGFGALVAHFISFLIMGVLVTN